MSKRSEARAAKKAIGAAAVIEEEVDHARDEEAQENAEMDAREERWEYEQAAGNGTATDATGDDNGEVEAGETHVGTVYEDKTEAVSALSELEPGEPALVSEQNEQGVTDGTGAVVAETTNDDASVREYEGASGERPDAPDTETQGTPGLEENSGGEQIITAGAHLFVGDLSLEMTLEEATTLDGVIAGKIKKAAEIVEEVIREEVALMYNGKGYIKLGFATWDAYCRDRLNYSKVHGLRLVRAAATMKQIEAPADANIPESVLRELNAVPEEARRDVYQLARELSYAAKPPKGVGAKFHRPGKVRAGHVKAAINQWRGGGEEGRDGREEIEGEDNQSQTLVTTVTEEQAEQVRREHDVPIAEFVSAQYVEKSAVVFVRFRLPEETFLAASNRLYHVTRNGNSADETIGSILQEFFGGEAEVWLPLASLPKVGKK